MEVSAEDLSRFQALIRERTGLHFEQWRFPALRSALLARTLATGVQSVDGYLSLLAAPGGSGGEISAVLDQITIGETCFFRYPAQFDFLRDVVLPDLLRRRSAQERPLRIWSAGCATGEEPYSAAITCLEALGPGAAGLVEISGTDVSASSLQTAQAAEYAERSLRLVDASRRNRYFRRLPGGRLVVREGVRQLVRFRESNLLAEFNLAWSSWDVIFCRNVLIYLAPEAVERAVVGLSRALRDDGCLLTGHSERLPGTRFMPSGPGGTFAYGKRPAAESLGPSSADARPKAAARRQLQPGGAAPAGREEAGDLDVLLEGAFALLDGGDYTGACARLDRLLRARPGHLDAMLLRAHAYLNLGRYEQSVAECEAALHVDPLAARVHLLRGMNFRKLSKPDLAVAELRKAAYLAPASGLVQFHLAEACRAAAMWDAARRAYRNAAELLPAEPEREVRLCSGGFGNAALIALCQQMSAETPHGG